MTDPGRPRLDPRERVDEEIRHHLQEKVDYLVARGWDEDAARREAERSFGDVRRIRRRVMKARREGGARAVEMLGRWASDLRHALRGVRSRPGFTAAVVLTLALGIGAASSIFAVADALLLRPLPYDGAERWVELNRATGDGAYSTGTMGEERVVRWRAVADDLVDGWVAFIPTNLVRTDGPRAEALDVVAVTPGAESLLGIPVLRGRGFVAEDARPGAPPVALLSEAYWERMGADPEILGRTLRLESGPVTVVGVLGGGIKFPVWGDRPHLWIPLRDDFSYADRGPAGGVEALWARLARGLDLPAAQDRFDVLAASLEDEEPSERSWGVRLVPVGAHRANRDVVRAVWTLSATVAVLFLITLVNGVNLLLVRGSGRTRELAVRRALGASRARLLRQLLAEGLVLGLLGGLAAVGLAWGAVAAVGAILPYEVLYFSPHAFELDGRTLLFAFGVSFLGGTVLGLIPGVQAVRGRDAPLPAGRGRDDSPTGRRVRNVLVVVQVALSMTLLAAAGLLLNGFTRLLAVDPGFDHERVARAMVALSETRYPDGASRIEFVQRLLEALEVRPAVQAVALGSGTGFSSGAPLQAEGEAPPEDQPFLVPRASVGPGYFETMGMRVMDGRRLDRSDAGTRNVVVDRDLARFLWGARSPVGRRFRLGEDGEWWTVVGVVGELTLMGRDQRRGPHQFLRPLPSGSLPPYVEIAMRSSGPPEALLPAFRETLRSLDPEQWIWKLHTAAAALAEEEQKPRFVVTLMSLLAGVAVTLAVVGLYGVLAYSVSRRDRELGIRLALGADRSRVRGMVLREGIGVATLGVALGLGGAVAASRLIEELLYEVEPRDPATMAVAGLLLLSVAGAASLLPALRATRVDPVEVLKAE